jgi:hypothetical protein
MFGVGGFGAMAAGVIVAELAVGSMPNPAKAHQAKRGPSPQSPTISLSHKGDHTTAAPTTTT